MTHTSGAFSLSTLSNAGPGSPRAAFEAAMRALPAELHETRIRVADRSALLRLVGDALASRLGAAFAATFAEPSEEVTTDLTIELWDRDRAGVAFPPALREPEWTWTGVDQQLAATDRGRVLRLEGRGAVTVLDRGARGILGSCDRAADIPLNEAAQPLSEPLTVWLHDRGVQRVHAAAVARDGRALLIAGPGGSGKSTTALACALDGWGYLGDDKVGIEEGTDGDFRALALYVSACADQPLLARHPRLVPHGTGGAASKSLIAMGRVPGVRLESAAPVRAVLIPRVIGAAARTSVRRISPVTALRALAPTSLLLPFGAGRPGLESLAKLVESTPCFAIDIGRDPETVADLAGEALDRAGGA